MSLDSHLSQVLELWASDPYISMAAIGRKLKISRERVRQLIEKAILKDKTVLSSEEREINRITARQKSAVLMKESLKLDIPPYAIHTTTILRKRLSALGLFVKCEMCDWNEEPSILVCHHVDRNRKNNNIINLLCICPNCHAMLHLVDKAMITNQNGIRIKGPNAIQNKYKKDHKYVQMIQ